MRRQPHWRRRLLAGLLALLRERLEVLRPRKVSGSGSFKSSRISRIKRRISEA
jgi:hypothetical protein